MVRLFLQNVKRGSEELQIGVRTERVHQWTLRNLADVSVRPLNISNLKEIRGSL